MTFDLECLEGIGKNLQQNPQAALEMIALLSSEATLMDGHIPKWLNIILVNLRAAVDFPVIGWQCECVHRLCQARSTSQVMAWMHPLVHRNDLSGSIAPLLARLHPDLFSGKIQSDALVQRELEPEQACEATRAMLWLWAAVCYQQPLLPRAEAEQIIVDPIVWKTLASPSDGRMQQCASRLVASIISRPKNDLLPQCHERYQSTPAWSRLLRLLPSAVRKTFSIETDSLKLQITMALNDDPSMVPKTLQSCLEKLKGGQGKVAWSAAKGVAQPAGRLSDPQAVWHYLQSSSAEVGTIWAMAEMFHAHLEPAVMPNCEPFLMSPKTAIRDAAAFLLWSMVRYSRQHVLNRDLFAELVAVSLLDAEATVRRAMLGVVQEAIGRQAHLAEYAPMLTLISGEAKPRLAQDWLIPHFRKAMEKHLLHALAHPKADARQMALNWIPHFISDLNECLVERAIQSNDLAQRLGALQALSHAKVNCERVFESLVEGEGRLTVRSLGYGAMMEASMAFLQMNLHESCLDRCLNELIIPFIRTPHSLQSQLISFLEHFSCKSMETFYRGKILPMADKDALPQAQLGAIQTMAAMPNWLLQDRWIPLMGLTVRWMQQSIDKRIQTVKCLSHWLSKVDCQLTAEWETALWSGLEDYTVDERGDSGSGLREAIIHLWQPRKSLADPRWRAELWRLSVERIDRIKQLCLGILGATEFNETDPLIRGRYCLGLVYAAGSPLPSQHEPAIQMIKQLDLLSEIETSWWQQERLIDGLIRIGIHVEQLLELTKCHNMNRLILVYSALMERHRHDARVQERLLQGHPYPRIQAIISKFN